MSRSYSMRGVTGAAERAVALAREWLCLDCPEGRVHDVQDDPRFRHRGVDLLWERPALALQGVAAQRPLHDAGSSWSSVLIGIFHKTESDAVAIMLHVHRTGLGVAGVYTRDVAQTKVDKVHASGQRARVSPPDHGTRGRLKHHGEPPSSPRNCSRPCARAGRWPRRPAHEYLTLEHLCWGCLQDDGPKRALKACGANPKRLEKKLRAF
jgi:hypothetical protein